MGKKLLIVESPAKAKTIKKYLGSDFDVRASVGHVRDLPVKTLGVEVEQGFAPTYEVPKDKEKVIADLKKAAAKADEVFLGPDPDREGEAIAWHIKEALGLKSKPVHRVLFHEITKDAMRKALAEPRPIDQARFESQQARRILDRLVGYNVSPLLWDKVKRGLSAGRVQSVALRLLVEREREIMAFRPEEYWSLTARLEAGEPPAFEAKLSKIGGEKAELKNQAAAEAAMAEAGGQPFAVRRIARRTVRPNPSPPFITSTLQQDAFNKLGFQAGRTMRLAQRLYEGVELGDEGASGLITYMRTDSPRVSPEAQQAARRYVAHAYGENFVPARPPAYRSPRGAQEAHEAIRPTDVFRTPDAVKDHLEPDMAALYGLIWRRYVASQMAPAEVDQTSVDVAAGEHVFRASGSKVRFEGFRRVYGPEEKDETLLPGLTEGQALKLLELSPKQHFTQPPPRFTDASLVKEMEENGIGRPSTYAAVLSTLLEKEYAQREKGRFRPSELGMLVTDLLVGSFPDLLDVAFTAQMEADLDQIEEGKSGWRETLGRFYDPFSRTLADAKKKMISLKGEGIKTDLTCPNCGAGMVIKFGRAGQFLACSAYPKCKTTSDFTRDETGRVVAVDKKPDQPTDQTCPNCGQPMVEKNGRFGKFLACAAYPECKTTRKIVAATEKAADEPTDQKCEKCGKPMVLKTTRGNTRFLACTGYPKCKNARSISLGVKCPRENCGGDLAERASKRGKVFFGCTNYPKCDYVAWHRPVPRKCSKCGHPFMLLKKLKAGETLACPAEGCGHKESAAENN